MEIIMAILVMSVTGIYGKGLTSQIIPLTDCYRIERQFKALDYNDLRGNSYAKCFKLTPPKQRGE